MTSPRELPEQLIAKFRSVQLERLDRLEACWLGLREGGPDSKREGELTNGLQALKGDSRALGYNDVGFLCQKLEDLLFFARQRRYQVPDELDMLVTMALQFMAVLIRKQVGAPLTGMDLKGFVNQLEEVLRSAQAAPMGQGAVTAGAGDDERISAATQKRLARIATNIYLEALNAWGLSVARLRSAWEDLVRETAALEALALSGVLGPERDVAEEKAKALGKRVEILLDVGGYRASGDVAEAVREAVRVALTRAVEDGVETAAQRTTAGKREAATVRVRAREEGDRIEVVVEDDGRGVDLGAVRGRALELKLLPRPGASEPADEELVELLFSPAFTPGGLSAARAAMKKVGGTAELWSRAGVGASVVLRAPRVSRRIDVLRLALPGSPYAFAVPASWSVVPEPSGQAPRLDPLFVLGLPRGEEPGRREVVRLTKSGMELELVCRGQPMLGTAERICPTDDEFAAEVVRISGTEALLLRPERMLPASARKG